MHGTVSDYHTSGAWVAVAVAALGVRLAGGDADTLRQAIGIAEYHGPRSQMMREIDNPTMLHDGSGWGAMVGVTSADLALAGLAQPGRRLRRADGHSSLPCLNHDQRRPNQPTPGRCSCLSGTAC